MKEIILEIRAAEGGEDAKLLVSEMASIYAKACEARGFVCRTEQSRSGFTAL